MHQLGSYKLTFVYCGSGGKPAKGETPLGCTCEVYSDSEDGLLIAWGNSWCHKEDQFRYSVARKVAFTHALNAYLSRELRTELWAEYWKVFPKDRVKVRK